MEARREREKKQEENLQTLLQDSRKSKAFGCIQLPDDFGNISAEELIKRYESACANISRPHLEAAVVGEYRNLVPPNAQAFCARPVRGSNSAGLRGAQQAAHFLSDQLRYLQALIREVHSIQDMLFDAFGGFCTDEENTYEITGLDGSLPVQLNPLGAYYLRAMYRFRMVQVDFDLVSGFIEQILDGCGQVCRGTLIPGMDMSRNDKNELATLWRSWESVYLDITLCLYEVQSGLSGSTLFYTDQATMRKSQKSNGNA